VTPSVPQSSFFSLCSLFSAILRAFFYSIKNHLPTKMLLFFYFLFIFFAF
jgi:hypothetical protein